LFLPDLVEVWDVGGCVVRLLSHVVAPVFHKLLCLSGCVPRCCFRIVFDSTGSAGVMFGPTLVVGHGISLFRCFVALYSRLTPLLSSGRDSLSQEFIAGRLWWRLVFGSVGGGTTFGVPGGASGVWATPVCSIPAVCLPTDVAAAVRVATSEEASPGSDVTLSFSGRAVCAGVGLRPFWGFPKGGLCVPTVLLMWLLGVSHGDTWLFLPDLVEVQDVGGCVVRLWSHMVALVFRELLYLGGCSSFASALLEFLLLWLIRGWRRDLQGSLAGVREVGSWLALQQGPSVSYTRVLLLLSGARAASVVVRFARAAVGFIFGLRVSVGVSRRLREPTCGMTFTGVGLESVEPVEGVLALLAVPLLL
ncbi:hypothetical protein Taro_022615, partial [Colocasia esculenta]|nr:hypothetical protein [Colocasia esculenta]